MALPDTPARFWAFADALLDSSTAVIDRPRGSCHPRFPQVVYPLDYGYLDGTQAMDGGGIDIWQGSAGGAVTAALCTIDALKRDAEIKLLIGCTEAEIATIHAFHNNSALQAAALIRRA